MPRALAIAGPVLLVVVGLVFAPSAFAQDDAYRETARAGVAAFNDDDLETAIARFEEARAIRPTPRIHRLLGRAQLAAGQSVEAARTFQRALRAEDEEFPLSDDMRAEITSELLPQALAGTAQVQLEGVPEGLDVQVDGEVAPRFGATLLLEPGSHTVSAPGYVPEQHTIAVAGGASETVSFAEASSETSTPPPVVEAEGEADLLPGVVMLIAGAVVAGGGGVMLGLGWDAASRVQSADFYPDVAADDDLARWMTPAGIAMLAAGGGLAAIGVLLMLPTGSQSSPVALRLGPGQLTASGRF